MATALLAIAACGLAGISIRGALRRRRLEAEAARLRAAARVEDETALRNREAFTEDLELELLRADRTGNASCLVVLGMGVEQVSDERRDPWRRDLARTIRTVVRAVDVGYRIATDEFALILPDTRAAGALVAARRVEHALESASDGAGLTAGVAELGPGIDRHQLFRNAYCALLAAGRNGRPTLLAYSPELEPAGRDPRLEQPIAQLETAD